MKKQTPLKLAILKLTPLKPTLFKLTMLISLLSPAMMTETLAANSPANGLIDSGFYAGGGLDYSLYIANFKCEVCGRSGNLNDGAADNSGGGYSISPGIFGGYEFLPHWSVEGAYHHFGRLEGGRAAISGLKGSKISATSLGVSVLYSTAASKTQSGLFFRLGYSWIHTRFTSSDRYFCGTGRCNLDNFNPLYGFGYRWVPSPLWGIPQQLGIRLEATNFGTADYIEKRANSPRIALYGEVASIFTSVDWHF